MELRQLKYFIKAAELQNFTDAAGKLFITQSTLSQQIKQLEDELKLPLFDRIAKRVRLTEAGKTFLPYARKTVKDAEDGRDMLKDLMDLNVGTLTIGVTYGLTGLLTKAVLDFTEHYPSVFLQIVYGTTQELMDKLDQGNLDLVLSFHQPDKSQLYRTEDLFSASISLIVHKNHLLANKKQMNVKQLNGLPLILPTAGYSIRGYLNALLKKHNLTPDIKMEVNDINTLVQLIESGRWATVLMSSSVFDRPGLIAIKIIGNGMNRLATTTWRADAYQKKSAIIFIDQLKENALN